MTPTVHRIWVHRDKAADQKWAQCETCGWKSLNYPGFFTATPEDMENDVSDHAKRFDLHHEGAR